MKNYGVILHFILLSILYSSKTYCQQEIFYSVGTEADSSDKLICRYEHGQCITYLVSFVCLGKAAFRPIHKRFMGETQFDDKHILDQQLLRLFHIHQSIAFNNDKSFFITDHECVLTRNTLNNLQEKLLIYPVHNCPDSYKPVFDVY